MLKVGVIVGSLRQDSFNKKLAALAMDVAPESLNLEIIPIGELPVFNQDLDSDMPEMVTQLKAQIEAVDAVLFITPEYNRSIPALVKNAIDWASRPEGHNSWKGKPAGIMGASNGQFGTIHSQYDLRKVLTHVNMLVMPQPQIMVTNSAKKLEGGNWDDKTREKVTEFMVAFAEWVGKFQ